MRGYKLQQARERAAEKLVAMANSNGRMLELDDARYLLHRCELYGSKSALMWERENDEGYYFRNVVDKDGNTRKSWQHQLDLLEARRQRLESELQFATGLALEFHNYGLYPTIVKREGNELREVDTLLYWAD